MANIMGRHHPGLFDFPGGNLLNFRRDVVLILIHVLSIRQIVRLEIMAKKWLTE
jgi:hypothetical protein